MRKIQAAARLFPVLAAIFVAACSTTTPTGEPATGCKSCPACPACPPAPTVPPAAAPFSRNLQPANWTDLPGWKEDDLGAAWPAFMASCRGVASKPHGAGWKRVCDLARAADGKPGHDPRRFFESQLRPYAIQAGDGNAGGLVTGYYEPLLRGSRTRSKGFEQPVRGVPEDLLTIDLSAIFPELKDKRVRGRLEGNGRAVAVTKNLGNTWTEHPTSRNALIEPACMASLHKHTYVNQNGDKQDLLFFFNPDSKIARNNFTLKCSTNDGLTWPDVLWTLIDQNNGNGYSCITSVDNDTIGILYEGSGANLIFLTIEIEEIIKKL